MSRQIEYLPLSDLRGNPANPKDHAADVIDASINRFGVVEPVVRDERTGLLISGHGRTETLQDMEERGDAPPDGVQTAEDGRWLVPVVVGWSSKDDAEAGAALIALNRAGEIGGWVDDALLDLLDDLSGDDLSGVGFDEYEIESLRRHLANIELADDVDSGEALDDDISPPLDISEGQMTVNVVIEQEKRSALYALLRQHDWVVDIRESRG